MPEKNYKPMLVIGILAVVVAMTGIFLLEPPGSATEVQPSEIPDDYQMVLRPEDLAAASAATPTVAAEGSAGRVRPSASASRRPTASRPAPSVSSSPERAGTATRSSRPAAATRRSASPAPPATVRPGAAPSGAPAEMTAPETFPPPQEASGSPPETVSPSPPDSSGSAADDDDTPPTEDEEISPSPVISHGGGLLPAADSGFTITTDGVREAGGMKLIEGFQATGTAVLRDIRNTLLTSSSLVKGYKDGEEIGGFEPIGTGTVLELSSRSGEVVDTAVVLMPGDATGSGTLDISQLARVAAAVKGKEPLEGVYLMAADIDGSGAVDEGDLMMMSYILNRRAARRAEQNA